MVIANNYNNITSGAFSLVEVDPMARVSGSQAVASNLAPVIAANKGIPAPYCQARQIAEY